MLKKLIQNIYKAPITSLVGVLLVIAAVYAAIMKVSTWLEVTPIITIGTGLLVAPDKIKKEGK